MAFRLMIAERPSVMQTIVAALGIKGKQDGYIESGDYLISWCVGHLVRFAGATVHGEQYKKWGFGSLPILPEGWQYAVDPDKGKQFKAIKELIHRANVSEAVNACDAGHEGELIFRFVCEVASYKKPVHRLWISSMEDGTIKAGFASLKDGRGCGALFTSALCRAKTDWLIGINATRLFPCLYEGTLNMRRVQVPTLKMLTDRGAAVSHFQKGRYYHVRLNLSGTDAASGRISDKAEADALKGACEAGEVVCVSPTREKKAAAPPKLFDLTSLQRKTNCIFGYTARQTLDLVQSPYKKRLLTYLRMDSNFLTDDMGGTVADIIALLCGKLPFMAGADFAPEITEVLGNKKMSDHHVIIPTMELAKADPDALPESEKNILTLTGARLLFATAEPHIYEAVAVVFSYAGTDFTARGKTVLAEGWKELERRYRTMLKDKPKAEDGKNEGVTLPELSEGQSFPNPAAKVTEHTITPPKPHSEASLLSAMERAGNRDTDPDVERRGLDTPAIRTAVIKKLVKDGFAERKGKQLIPTQNGAALILVLPDMLTSSQLTAEWKDNLTQIVKGAANPGEFLFGIRAMVRRLMQTHAAALDGKKGLFRGEKPSVDKYPRCGPPVHEEKKNYYCSNKECAFVMWESDRFFEERKTAFSAKIAAVLPESGKVNVKRLYSPKTGKTYDGTVILADTGGKYANCRTKIQKN